MKLVKKVIERDASGFVELIAEEGEDMWHVYNLLLNGDRIKATTFRRVQNESTTGSVTSERVRTVLTVEVTDVFFDTQAFTLRINGKNTEENPHVKMGAFHTIDLELNRKFTLYKQEWDSVSLERVKESCDISSKADVGAVVLQEGLAYVCLISSSMTVIRTKVDVSIPRKRRGGIDQHDKGLRKFFEQILQSILQHFDFSVIKCVVLASAGFLNEVLLNYIKEQTVKRELKVLSENKQKFMLAHSASGHKHALQEAMQDPAVVLKLRDTKAQAEVTILNQFYKCLNDQPDRAFYGFSHVHAANEEQAVATLMILDSLFRSQNVEERKKYVQLVDAVKDNGGEVLVFSSMHGTGEQLKLLTGVAAILRFPCPHIEDIDNGNDSEDERDA
ncbi:protein pelota [Sphaeroforma arctica JP610]|uniref:Protein pelota homolog n=1 Tax=Sphaeroforma arctica JP610 TaxID=667725 RepID=A0A0L0GE00_9EUKA|nr:protein pelota [Sphaeroforma arctica JP610]KNC87252.1 protein pelota [Sphaeroforma arctica JP610]|eukprot:XP_014161154.1 protein pelota [Sphaeroforma arctica JP610]